MKFEYEGIIKKKKKTKECGRRLCVFIFSPEAHGVVVVKAEHQQYCVLGPDAWRFGVLVFETSLKNEINFGLCSRQPAPGALLEQGSDQRVPSHLNHSAYDF